MTRGCHGFPHSYAILLNSSLNLLGTKDKNHYLAPYIVYINSFRPPHQNFLALSLTIVAVFSLLSGSIETILANQTLSCSPWSLLTLLPFFFFLNCLQSIDFLSTVIDNQDVTAILLQPLIKVGFVDHVISLLASEIKKISDESKFDRYGEQYSCELN